MNDDGIIRLLRKTARSRAPFQRHAGTIFSDGTVHRGKKQPGFFQSGLLQWGETFQKVMNFDLAPYKDFRELMERGTPDASLMKNVDTRYEELKGRQELKKKSDLWRNHASG